jgi:ribosomal protein S18 acetylase RimI-like enzyme
MKRFEETFSKGTIPGCTIRPLFLEDESDILHFLEECSDYKMMECGQPVQPEDARSFLFDIPPEKNLDDKFVFAIEINARIIALVDVLMNYKGENVWWIGLLLIHPDMRDKGLGRQIVDFLRDNFIHQNVREIRLGVLEENIPGQFFWKRMGFNPVELIPNRQFGIKNHTLIVMSKQLI